MTFAVTTLVLTPFVPFRVPDIVVAPVLLPRQTAQQIGRPVVGRRPAGFEPRAGFGAFGYGQMG